MVPDPELRRGLGAAIAGACRRALVARPDRDPFLLRDREQLAREREHHALLDQPELLEPDKTYEYQIDVWQTGITVKAGSRLRVEVASAAFPLFSGNLNTGGHNEKET